MDKIMRPSSMNPEAIISKLFSFHNKAHYYHLQTDTIGKHKLLDELYKDLVEHKDSIGEFLLGVQIPKRFNSITMETIEPYSDMNMMRMINDGIEFSKQLCAYADEKGWEELCNLSSDLQKSFVKAKLFTTYI